MAETGKLIGQKQDAVIWEGLQAFRDFPDWMGAARDPEGVRAALTAAVPEFLSGKLSLLDCDSGYFRYKGDKWSALYALMISKPDDSETSTINLQGILRPPGVLLEPSSLVEGSLGGEAWHAVIPDLNLELWTKKPEAVLSSLEMLTDPERSRQYLTSLIRSGSSTYRDIQIDSCRPKVVRYKPGSRCAIAYDLSYAPEADAHQRGPGLVVAKTYRNEKGQHAYESMLAFWHSALGAGNIVRVAEPLAYDPLLRVMIQGPIHQQMKLEQMTLEDLTATAMQAGSTEAMDELTLVMRKTARGLAALHGSGAVLDTVYRWQNDEAQVRETIEELSVSIPPLGTAGKSFVDRLSNMEASSPPDALVPSHGTFRPAQVLLHDGKIGFIDFDSCCRAEPAKDLGLFLCAFLRAGMGTVDSADAEINGGWHDGDARLARFRQLLALSDIFLAEYESCDMPVNRERVALMEALELFTLILHAWTKIKVRELENTTYTLERFLQAHEILK